jgi:thiosulfate dehydrogenase [quinone] large subunit
MSTIVRNTNDVAAAHTAARLETREATAFHYVAAATRVVVGWIFVWAFLDKLFALGFATGRDPKTGVVDRFGPAAWIHGGSPTQGFLKFGTQGPFADFYKSFAGAAWADWLFMLGLAGIGLALMLGVTMRLATYAGALLLMMMWSAALWPANNPFVDEHIVYVLVLFMLLLSGAGTTFGLGRWWDRTRLVRRFPILK